MLSLSLSRHLVLQRFATLQPSVKEETGIETCMSYGETFREIYRAFEDISPEK